MTLRKVPWQTTTALAANEWLTAHPEDVSHRGVVVAAIGRAHRDATLENFLCETKRHLEVFNGAGKARTFYPPCETDGALLLRAGRGPLG